MKINKTQVFTFLDIAKVIGHTQAIIHHHEDDIAKLQNEYKYNPDEKILETISKLKNQNIRETNLRRQYAKILTNLSEKYFGKTDISNYKHLLGYCIGSKHAPARIELASEVLAGLDPTEENYNIAFDNYIEAYDLFMKDMATFMGTDELPYCSDCLVEKIKELNK